VKRVRHRGYVILGSALVMSPSQASAVVSVDVETRAAVSLACCRRFSNSKHCAAVGQMRKSRPGLGFVASNRLIL
jgi:hypothetical protein